jgi:Na+/proline symporter
MEFLGLDLTIWVVLAVYLLGVLALGWWSRRGTENQEGYLLGNRRFGSFMMIMHSFGSGTHPGAPAGVVSKTVSAGAAGVWVSWVWLFGTPFYWLIAPVVRRMRYLTMADYFEHRFSRAAGVLYVAVATVGMTILLGSVLLATARTVQGMMGEAAAGDVWFFGILLTVATVFISYSYWGGIVAAIRTDMVQGLLIIALSVLAIPAALRLPEVGGMGGARETLFAENPAYLSLFDTGQFNLWTVLLLSVSAPLSMLAMPHLMSVCAAGRSEWEGRVGFTYGNILKRLCTIGWCVLGLAWLAYLIRTGRGIHPDAAFGDCIRGLLSPVLQGVMLACVIAAAMSSGDTVQVTLGGLLSQNLYRPFLRPQASDRALLVVTRRAGLAVSIVSVAVAVLMRDSVVRAILDYVNVLSLVGVSVAMGLLWRRMNTAGVFCSVGLAVIAFVMARYVLSWPRNAVTGLPLLAGVLGGLLGSYLAKPPETGRIEEFFKRIYVPIRQESRLGLTLAEVVPPERRLLTWGGLFLVRPSRQSWVGFLVALALCMAAVLFMYSLVQV